MDLTLIGSIRLQGTEVTTYMLGRQDMQMAYIWLFGRWPQVDYQNYVELLKELRSAFGGKYLV